MTMVVDNIVEPTSDKLVTTFQYDDAGRQTVATDAAGHSTRTYYDQLGRVVKTAFDDGTVTETIYDHLGQRTGEVAQHTPAPGLDKSPLTTNYEYDSSGRLTAVILPPVEDPSNPTGPLVRPRYEYEYDIYGNQVVIRDNVVQELDGTVDYDHDDNNPGNDYRETFFSYDQFGRQVARTLPLGVEAGFNGTFQEQTEYDVAGRLARSIDFEGRTTDYVYDDLGRLDKKQFFDAVDPPNGVPGQANNFDEITDYFFDALGRQTKVHQDLNHDGLENSGDRITENFFDSFGRLTDVETDFDGDGTPDTYVNYKYNDLGQLERTATGSDPANNPTTATEYVYDRIGRLEEVKATHRDGSELTTPETTTYQYDAVGNLQQVLRHGGVGTVYTYDTLNRLTDLINFYDDNSDGLYDPDDPATANDNDDGDPLISSFRYTLRDDGKRTAAVEWFPGEGYENTTIGTALLTHRYVWEYDNAGRLISEELDRRDLGSGSFYDYTDTFSYDLVGNRTEYVRSGSSIFYDHYTKTYQYDANDRLVWEKDNLNSDSSIDNTTLYQYDNPAQAGDDNEGTRQTGKKKYNGDNEAGTGSPLSSTDYSYNLQGRLSEVDDGSDVTSYQYDYAGFRIETDVDGTVTRFLIDANNHSGHTQVLEEHDDSGNLERSYLLGHDVIAQHDTTNGLLYLIYDGHGSTRMLVGNTGITLRQSNDTPQIFAYTAYGEILDNDPVTLTAADDAQTVLLHTGEWFEHSTGWQYNRERWYDSSTGRWKRMDDFSGIKEDPQSLHKYLYTHADPVNGIDPTGLFSVVGIGVAGSIRNVLVGLDLSVLGGVNATVEGVQAGLSAQQIFVGLILDDILATVDLIVYTVAYALDVIESGINYVVGNEGQLRDSGGVAQASLGSFLFAKYSKLRNPSAIYQRNHLNTDAAWGNSRGGVIPHSQGVAVTLQGSKNQVGSEHFKFHLEMEKFFDKHRGGSKRPTTDQYNEALERALRKAGATLAQAKSLTKYAIAQQMAFGYSGRRPIPRLPDPDSFLKSFL